MLQLFEDGNNSTTSNHGGRRKNGNLSHRRSKGKVKRQKRRASTTRLTTNANVFVQNQSITNSVRDSSESLKIASILNTDTQSLKRYRPQRFTDVVGRDREIEVLRVMVAAVKTQWKVGDTGIALDHILFYGPPGVGKTTLAGVVANELGVDIIVTSGPAIERAADLVAILTRLKAGDILFIDEIHRLKKSLEETLYSAMEDYKVDIVTSSQGDGQAIRLSLEPFTLIGATTRIGSLSAPLRDRFGLHLYLDLLDIPSLVKLLEYVIKRDKLVVKASKKALREIAIRSRGTPRIAIRLYKRVRDYMLVNGVKELNQAFVVEVLGRLGIDNLGLDSTDRFLLRTLIKQFNGGPVGLKALASVMGEDPNTIEEVYEPYLIKLGLLLKTNRGRVITPKAFKHITGDIMDNR